MHRIPVFLLFSMLAAELTVAQVREDSTLTLPGIVVVDSLEAESRERAIRLRFLGPERLQNRPAESVADLLSNESFLFIPRLGPTGLATASLRGFGSVHTHVYLDGLVLADPQTGQVDLGMLPALFFESVSVGHGGAATENGSGALGGTVHLETIRPRESAVIRVLGSAAAFGSYQAGLSASRPIKGIRTLLAANLSASDGSFSYDDKVRFPAVKASREGSDRTSRNLYGRIEGGTGPGGWFAALWWADGDRGVPGPSNSPPIPARQKDRSLRIWMGSQVPIFSGRIRFSVLASQASLSYRHPDPSISSESRTRVLETRVNGYRVISNRWLADFGIRAGYDRTELRGGTEQIRSLVYLSASGSGARWRINPGISAEFNSHSGTSLVRLIPRLSLRGEPVAGLPVALVGSISRVFRVPTFNERYWLPGGNPDLRPEEGWSADLGVSVRVGGDSFTARGDVTLHWSRLEDRVIWIPGLAGPAVQVWRPENVGLVVGSGYESSVDLEFSILRQFSASVRLLHSYSRVEDRSDESTRSYRNQLRYAPEHVFKSIFSIRFAGIGGDVISSVTGRRYVTADESRHLAGHHIVSARLHGAVRSSGGTIRLVGSVENVTDRSYEHIRFYPMPGRHARLSLVYEIGQNKLKQ